MKIAIFSDTFPPQVNGVAGVASSSALMLAEAGHEVRVFAVTEGSPEYLKQLSRGRYQISALPSLPFWGYPGLRMYLPFGAVRRAMKGWRPDVIHTHTSFGVGLAAVQQARRLKVPLVGTHHTFFDHYLKHIHLDFAPIRRLSWRVTVGYYNRCTLMLSPSKSLADGLVENGLKRPVKILPNSINTELFKPAPHPHGEAPVLVYMGRLSYEKSIDQVVETTALVVKQWPETKLLLIGDGPERSALEQQVAALKIVSQVEFLGMQRDQALVSALNRGNFFLTASKSENMPLSVLEGMATGLPVMAARAKGLPEIVNDGETGLLSKPDRPDEMAANIIKLWKDQSEYRRISQAAHDYTKQLSPKVIAQKTITLYEELIKNR